MFLFHWNYLFSVETEKAADCTARTPPFFKAFHPDNAWRLLENREYYLNAEAYCDVTLNKRIGKSAGLQLSSALRTHRPILNDDSIINPTFDTSRISSWIIVFSPYRLAQPLRVCHGTLFTRTLWQRTVRLCSIKELCNYLMTSQNVRVAWTRLMS